MSGPQLFNILTGKLPGPPRGNLGLKATNPLRVGLVAAYTGISGDFASAGGFPVFQDITRRRINMTTSAGPTRTVVPSGVHALDFNGTDATIETGTADNPLAGLTNLSVTIAFSSTDTTGLDRIMSNGGNDDFELGTNYSGGTVAGIPDGNLGMFIRDTSGSWLDLGALSAVGQRNVVTVTGDGSDLKGYIDGVNNFSTGAPLTNGVDGILKLAGRFSSGALNSCKIEYLLIHNRVLPDSEVISLFHDPFQIYRERGQRTYIFPAHFPPVAAAPAAGIEILRRRLEGHA